MKYVILMTITFLLLPFCISAEVKIPDNLMPAQVKESAQESKVQKDKNIDDTAQKVPEDSTIEIVSQVNSDEIKNIEKDVGQPVHTNNTNQNTNENISLRVASATEWNAYATIAIAILTIILAIETVRLRLIQAKQIKLLNEAAIKPKVELFLDTNKYSINLLEIHVVNNGNGTANNIKFTFEADNNESIETSNLIISKIKKINFFKIGLRYLGAGQNKKSFLMSATEREFGKNDTFFKSTIFVTITCEDDLGKEYTNKYTINMSEFQGIRTIGSDPAKDIANNLKKICDSFTSVVSFSSGTKRIQTDTYDDTSREIEEKEIREMLEKQKEI